MTNRRFLSGRDHVGYDWFRLAGRTIDGWSGTFTCPCDVDKGRYGHGVNLTHAGETVAGAGIATWAGYDDDAPPRAAARG